MVRLPWPTQLLGPLRMQPAGASLDRDSCDRASRFSTAEEVSSHRRVRSGNPDISSISLGRRLGLELSPLSSLLIRSCRLCGQSIRDRSAVFLLYRQLTGRFNIFPIIRPLERTQLAPSDILWLPEEKPEQRTQYLWSARREVRQSSTRRDEKVCLSGCEAKRGHGE